ncbi:ABC transporter permease subunit [Bacillus sp. REN10]|uniref:ABC transporter permease n=1 Tax=Bacillus sp. REN10 TaxID=2782541 RepID=UPI00193B1F81|nr:ABC transporter permease subunit [Bacillus sp. REN10]
MMMAGIASFYLVLPLLATLLYSFATDWNATILPEGYTLQWYQTLFQDIRFFEALGRSLWLSLISTFLGLVIIVPTVFSIVVYAPKLERFIQVLVIMTYAMPGVILAVGLIRTYSDTSLSMIFVIIGAYFVSILPFMYQGTRNSLRTIHATSLMEAAELLGANRWMAFRSVIIPNILSGLLVSSLLSFSILFGEFVLINLVLGGRFETVQMFLYQQLSKSGHIASAIVVCYFLLMCIVSLTIIQLTKVKKEKV